MPIQSAVLPAQTKRTGLMPARIGSLQNIKAAADDERGVAIEILDATDKRFRGIKAKPLCLNENCVLHGPVDDMRTLEDKHPSAERLAVLGQSHVFVLVGQEKDPKSGAPVGPHLYMSTER